MNIYKLPMLWRRHRYDVAAWFERHSHHFVYAVLFIGFVVALNVLVDDAYSEGFAQGYQLRGIEHKTAWEKGFEDEFCAAWWFKGNKLKAAQAIQKVQLK